MATLADNGFTAPITTPSAQFICNNQSENIHCNMVFPSPSTVIEGTVYGTGERQTGSMAQGSESWS